VAGAIDHRLEPVVAGPGEGGHVVVSRFAEQNGGRSKETSREVRGEVADLVRIPPLYHPQPRDGRWVAHAPAPGRTGKHEHSEDPAHDRTASRVHDIPRICEAAHGRIAFAMIVEIRGTTSRADPGLI